MQAAVEAVKPGGEANANMPIHLFDKIYDEVHNILALEIWPRYNEVQRGAGHDCRCDA